MFRRILEELIGKVTGLDRVHSNSKELKVGGIGRKFLGNLFPNELRCILSVFRRFRHRIELRFSFFNVVIRAPIQIHLFRHLLVAECTQCNNGVVIRAAFLGVIGLHQISHPLTGINELSASVRFRKTKPNNRVAPFQFLTHMPLHTLHIFLAACLGVFVTCHTVNGMAVRLGVRINIALKPILPLKELFV